MNVKIFLMHLQVITDRKRNEFLRRVKVPYDIGRLPSNLNEKSSFSGCTAEQLKNFAIVYARACLKGLIPDASYKVLCLLCNIVILICQPAITMDSLTYMYRLLQDHHLAYSLVYGKFKVTVTWPCIFQR